MDRPGSNAHALKTANSQLDLSRKMSGHAATQSSFITELDLRSPSTVIQKLLEDKKENAETKIII